MNETKNKTPTDPVAGSEYRWVIVGIHGLYEGQWVRKSDAIAVHCADIGRDWECCKRHGDRALKVRIQWPNPNQSGGGQ